MRRLNRRDLDRQESQRREMTGEASPVALPDYDVVALVLQGGGALGAYQAGVYQGLHEAGIRPTWLAGISIGALNAAVIAGSPEAQRVDRLREFWETICAVPVAWPAHEDLAGGFVPGDFMNSLPVAMNFRSAHNITAALRALLMGQPGFFKPRFPPPFLSLFAGDTATSFYDTAPLRDTLERLVDFDRLNAGDVRVSVGAVNIRRGNLVYFDTANRRLRAEHFMASGALPPGFPAVEIDGEYYWDGGMVSNTPLSRVLSSEPRRDTLTFQVDLWPAKGRLPSDLMEVASRQKDIQYSSRTRAVTNQMLQMQKMRQALQQVIDRLPAAERESADLQAIADLASHRAYNIIHLIYQSKAFEGHSKDYEFGLAAMREHWQSGLDDIRRTLADPRRLERPSPEQGIATHDIHREERDL
jgi:NTE family protein